MGDGPGESSRGDEDVVFTRRRLLFGGSALVAGGAATGLSTGALFRDQNTSSGTIYVDDDYQLNYDIVDNTDNVSGNKATYTVYYQVEWLADFAMVDLTVQNLSDGGQAFQDDSTSTEDSFSFQQNGGAGDEYEFTFTVSTSNGQYDQQMVTDTAGGDGPSQGDMGSADSPTLDSFYVTDRTNGNKASFTVDPAISNTSDFGYFEVFFDNQSGKDQADETLSSPDPAGTVDYDSQQGGTGSHQYEITVRVYNSSGVATDSGSIQHTAGDSDQQWTA